MAEQTLLTEAEVENALREADRFAKVFRAFASLGDVAQRHIRMRREISRMEGDKAATVAATAKAKEAQAKAESEHVAKVAKLEAEFKQKRSEIEREHGEQITGLKSAIAKASARSETAEKSAKTAEEDSKRRVSDADKAIADAQSRLAGTLKKIDESIAAKQAEFDRVKSSFDAFLETHKLK